MATTTRARDVPAGRRQRRLSGRLLAGAVLIVGIVVLYANGARYADTDGAPPAAVTDQGAPRLVPSVLGSLDRAWVITGDEAARQIASLHIGTVRVVEAEVAGYGADTTIWVATASSAPAARRMLAGMVRAIDRGDTPFARPAPVPELPGTYRTSADGQAHLFFASGDAVWWVATTPERALEDARSLYRGAAQ